MSRIKLDLVRNPASNIAWLTVMSLFIDVQLCAGELDESVRTQSNAASIAEKLPQKPETHWIEKGNHFALMVVACREAFKQDDPEEYPLVCGDSDGFNRHLFHTEMHKEMIRILTARFNSNN